MSAQSALVQNLDRLRDFIGEFPLAKKWATKAEEVTKVNYGEPPHNREVVHQRSFVVVIFLSVFVFKCLTVSLLPFNNVVSYIRIHRRGNPIDHGHHAIYGDWRRVDCSFVCLCLSLHTND